MISWLALQRTVISGFLGLCTYVPNGNACSTDYRPVVIYTAMNGAQLSEKLLSTTRSIFLSNVWKQRPPAVENGGAEPAKTMGRIFQSYDNPEF